MNLLIPEGAKHTGTGKSREYSADTIYRAAVLVELAKWRVPMTVLADAFATFTDDSESEWELAIQDDLGRATVYLTMTWSDSGSKWILQCDFPLVDAIEEYYSEDTVEMEPIRNGESVPASIIAINLSRLFRWIKL